MTDAAPDTVTVIDDDPSQLAMLVRMLQRGGFNASGFRQARDGIPYIIDNRPDAVVLDLWMPEIDGIEALQQLQASAPEVPVIVVSGLISSSRDGYFAQLTRGGAVACLAKPVRGAELCDTVRGAIAARRPPQTDQDSARSTV